MESKITHLLYCPFTGLGLYGGHRGSRWLHNRIQIFKQFVVPSLETQTNKNFILWISWRNEEKYNKDVSALKRYLNANFKTIFTYSGVCFWDDKYADNIARLRLINALHGSMGEVINHLGECQEVLMTIQPSDDCYHKNTVEGLRAGFQETDCQVIGFTKGYVMDYVKGELAEWNPKTIPPFFTIRFPREIFIDPLKHIEYTGPYKSHEYIGDKLKLGTIDERGFIVGCHGSNISTVFDHPYKGNAVDRVVLEDFGLRDVENLLLQFSINSAIFRLLPYAVKKKLRYLAGEKKWILRPLFSAIYNFLRA